jgi:signal peptidase II
MTKWLALIAAAVLAAADQLIKVWAVMSLEPVRSIEIIPGIFSLTFVRNYGAAFGILQNQRILLIAVVTLVVLAGVYLIISGRLSDKPVIRMAALILAGGVGNLIDRIRLGYVVDYISVGRFPVFNFADCCVVVGTFALLFYTLRQDLKKRENPDENTDSESSR